MKKLACIICDWCRAILRWDGDEDTSLKLEDGDTAFCNSECMRSWWAYGNSPLRTYDGKLEDTVLSKARAAREKLNSKEELRKRIFKPKKEEA